MANSRGTRQQPWQIMASTPNGSVLSCPRIDDHPNIDNHPNNRMINLTVRCLHYCSCYCVPSTTWPIRSAAPSHTAPVRLCTSSSSERLWCPCFTSLPAGVARQISENTTPAFINPAKWPRHNPFCCLHAAKQPYLPLFVILATSPQKNIFFPKKKYFSGKGRNRRHVSLSVTPA